MENKILAKVGTLTVTEAEVTEFIAGLGQRGAAYNTPEGRRAVLNQLVSNKLLLLDAQRNLYEAESEFRAQLARLKEDLLINYAADKAISSVKVTEADVKKYYEENKAQFATGETVNASHILVSTEEEATRVLGKINSGEMTFEEAAQTYSSCPSKEAGGNLGDFGRGQMVPEFDTAVFEMNVGEITDTPVKTQFGYHLIKLNAKNESKELAFEEVRGDLEQMMFNEKRREAYEHKINQLKIMYPVDILTI